MADYIVNKCFYYNRVGHKQKKYLKIVECGAGRGTNAFLILERLRKIYPEVYTSLNSYTLLDTSATLQALQNAIVSPLHGEKVEYIHQDLGDDNIDFRNLVATNVCDDTQVVMIGLEVLDNLPHDKIMRSNSPSQSRSASYETCDHYFQAEIKHSSTKSTQTHLEEHFVPLTDRLIKTVINDLPDFAPDRNVARWIPSVACRLIRDVYQNVPDAHLIFADFDFLPPPSNLNNEAFSRSFDAEWGPLVTDMKGLDYACYLGSSDLCDILFPTDFDLLARYVELHGHSGLKVETFKQGQFMKMFGGKEISLATSWINPSYSPLIEEFMNCSILSVTNR